MELEEALERVKPLATEALEMHLAFVRDQPTTGAAAAAESLSLEQGVLFAEGDSWFDYPGSNVLESLEWHFDFDVESVAHNGDTLEEIVYDKRQVAKMISRLRKLEQKGQRPRAILVSGGGNDLAGDELGVVLNHRDSGLEPLNRGIADALNARLRVAWLTYIGLLTNLSQEIFGGDPIPILIHGYDYPVPDGRGVFGGFWLLPGPWLRPAFRRKGYPAEGDLELERTVMRDLIDLYNTMVRDVGDQVPHVHYVEIPGTLSNAPADYRDFWRDELHPTNRGFRLVAARFNEVIQSVA